MGEPSFRVPRDWKDKHPKGCFMIPCGHGTGTSYFYNPIGDMPLEPVGTPVCSRPKFLNGTDNSNGGCPAGYANIMHEEVCQQTAGCLGHCIGEPFRKAVSNNSMHELFPEGCLID